MSLLTATKDVAQGQLNSGISASSTSIVLMSSEGAEFPQPYTGTASSTGSSTTLNDTGDLGNVNVGDIVYNFTDGSWAVCTVGGTNSITTTILQGGSDDTWQSGDRWVVNPFVISIEAEDGSGNVTKREKALIINRSTDTLTVETNGRGYDGSIAQSFDASDYVRLNVLSVSHENIKVALADLAQWENTNDGRITTLESQPATMEVTAETGAYNAVANDLVVCDASGGSFTVTLPASPSANDRIGVILDVTSGSNAVTIAGNGKNIQDAASQLLYVDGDMMILQYNGTQWNITNERITSHKCRLTRDAALSLTGNTPVKIAFDAEDYDIGSIGDIATNDRVDIRRAGKYMITASLTLAMADGTGIGLDIKVNGTSVRQMWTSSPAAAEVISSNVAFVYDFAASDYIEMEVTQEDSTKNSLTSESRKPTMEVTEIR